MLFSIIVPVYKVEAYLEKCIDSILSQDYQEFEILLVDDGSPDNCPAICDRYAAMDSRIRVFHKKNGGVSSARNLGIENAKGEWIWFVDSDDYIQQGALQNLSAEIAKSDADLYCFNCSVSGTYFYDIFPFFYEHYFKYCLGFGPCNKIYRKSIIEKHTLSFDTNEIIGEDLLFNLTYYRHMSRFTYVPKQLYCYVDRSDSAMHSHKPERLSIQLRLFNKINAYYKGLLCEEIRCILFLMHLISGLNQSQGSSTNHGALLKQAFSDVRFSKHTWITATKCFLSNEGASFAGRLRVKSFLYLCRSGRYNHALKLFN